MKHDESAFPMYAGEKDDFSIQYGITVRQYFAAKAMQGLLASGRVTDALTPEGAVKLADALIAALNKEETK